VTLTERLIFPLLVLLTAMQAAPAAWENTDPDTGNVAYIGDEQGQQIALLVDDRNLIFLRMQLSQGFEAFGASNCPTFQIDARKPMHHFEVGDLCSISPKEAIFSLGHIVDRRIKSLILHRIMNGNAITFRYTISNGQYREARFSLSGSKQSMRRMLGYNLQVDVD